MNFNSEEYDAAHIRKTRWGKCKQLEGGGWETIWELRFAVAQHGSDYKVYEDQQIGYWATLTITGELTGELKVITRGAAMSAEYYPPTFESFRIVNDTIVELEEIEGLPRDWYSPFRYRG